MTQRILALVAPMAITTIAAQSSWFHGYFDNNTGEPAE